MQNISEYTRSQARQAADKEFSRLVGTAALHIYTDTCFSLDFILRHASELRKHHHRVKVTKSVQLELEYKRKQPWALRKQNELRKRSEIFEFLPRSKAERRRFYKQSKSPVYADEDFELRFRDEDESPKVFLTADRELAQKIAALPSPPTIFLEFTPKHSAPHSSLVILWNDYQKLRSCQTDGSMSVGGKSLRSQLCDTAKGRLRRVACSICRPRTRARKRTSEPAAS